MRVFWKKTGNTGNIREYPEYPVKIRKNSGKTGNTEKNCKYRENSGK
jgi:hypothetical protein